MNYWLVKSDPETYSWNDLVRDKKTSWDGIRNYAARNHLKNMKEGDKLLVYHSGGESEVVGLAHVTKEFFHDPTAAPSEDWVTIELQADRSLSQSVTLKEIKLHPVLKNMVLVKISRLSVSPVTKEEYELILSLGE